MMTIYERLNLINTRIEIIKAELAEWEKMNPRIPDVRNGKASLLMLLAQHKQMQVLLRQKLDRQRDVQYDQMALEFEGMDRYERGLDS